MRFLFLLVLTSGCAVPFSYDHDGSFTLPLGVMSAGCEGSGSEDLESGAVSYTQRRAGEECVIDATWTGPLFDMADVRDEADARGADVEITSIGIDVTDAAVTDGAGEELDAGVAYEASLFVAGDEIVQIGDEVVVRESGALVEAANEAYDERGAIEGTGIVHAAFDVAELMSVIDARMPTLSIGYTIHIEGNAGL